MRAWALWALPLLCRASLAVLPAKPENISCNFYYKKNFTCTWSPEKEVGYTWYTVRRTHRHGNTSDICTSSSENGTSCSFLSSITIPNNYTIQVEARNADGAVESDITHWYLNTIVRIEPPTIISVQPVLGIKRMLQIRWERPPLAPASSDLTYCLRFRTASSARWMDVSFEEEWDGNQTYPLTGLQPFTEYVVALQCVAKKSKFWSGWSSEKRGTTEEEGKLVSHDSFPPAWVRAARS